MWNDLDFSKLNITFCVEDTEFRLVEAKRTLFYENFPNHMHSFFELHYICGGEGVLVLPDGAHPLSAGVLYLIPPKLFHEQRTYWQNLMEEYSFSFDIRKVKVERSTDLYEQLSGQEFWMAEHADWIAPFFYVLEEEAKQKESGYADMIEGVLKQLVVKLLRNMQHRKAKAGRSEPVGYERRKFIIDETMIYQYRDITLEKLAEYLNLSVRQTARILKEEYGMSFLELRTRSRLNAAATLLAGTKTPVNEVAELVGYDNAIYFSQQFRRLFGVTPSVYRKA